MPGSKRGKQSRQRNAQHTEAPASVDSAVKPSIVSEESPSDADARASAFAARAIELNDAASMTLLARVYLHGGGGGVRPDKAAARRLLERAALLDHVPAMTALAGLLCDDDTDSTSTMESRAQAAVWYRRASERGDIEATYRLAKVMLSVGQDVVRDSVVFSDSIPVRASSIVPRIVASPAASIPQRSFSVTPSKSIAKTPTSLRMLEVCSLLSQAAAAGHAMAAGTLAALYQNGTQSVEQNDVKALLWYCKGADLGNAACACAAGDLYRRGSLPALPLSATTSNDSVVPDLNKAIEYFEKGAAAGHALSMVYLATMLSRGQGVTKDMTRARELFRSGALQGDSLCMLGLARLLEDQSNELAESSAQGSASNRTEALLWYQRASEAGCLAATEKLQEFKQT